MPELRIILLVVGVLFVAAIAGFEWWRSRGARPLSAMPSRDDDAGTAGAARETAARYQRGARHARVAAADSLPVIELASTSESGTRRALGISISDDVAVDVAARSAGVATRGGTARARLSPTSARTTKSPRSASSTRTAGARSAAGPCLAGRAGTAHRHPAHHSAHRTALSQVARLRQAFSAAGFWHGPLDIYHLPDDSGPRDRQRRGARAARHVRSIHHGFAAVLRPQPVRRAARSQAGARNFRRAGACRAPARRSSRRHAWPISMARSSRRSASRVCASRSRRRPTARASGED